VVATIVLRHLGIRSLAYGYVLAQLIIIIPFGALLLRELRRQELLQKLNCIRLPIREIFSFSVPLMASNIVGMMGTSIPVLLLGYFHPMSTVAYYRVVLPVATLSNMVLDNFMSLYLPTASRLFAKEDIAGVNQLFWQTSLWMTVLAFPVFLTTTCFARPLTIFLYSARYAPSASILAILACGYFFNVTLAFNAVTLKVLGKIRLMVILNIMTTAVIVLFNLALIPHYGAIGAAAGTAAGVITQNLIRQVGLWLGSGGVSFFERQYASFFLVLGSSALGLYLIHLLTPNNIYLAAALALSASALVLWLVKKHLKITDTFPEVLRLPLVGRLFA
jgi:O-antigen/teichoic acid export membrane protein